MSDDIFTRLARIEERQSAIPMSLMANQARAHGLVARLGFVTRKEAAEATRDVEPWRRYLAPEELGMMEVVLDHFAGIIEKVEESPARDFVTGFLERQFPDLFNPKTDGPTLVPEAKDDV